MLNKYELKKEIENTNSEYIDDIMAGLTDEVEFIGSNYNDIKDLLISKGFKNVGEYETNGYQIDFWDYFDYDDKHYMLSGSLYYGNMCLVNSDN